MWHCRFFTLLGFFAFLLAITHKANSSPVNSHSADLINATCKLCANKSTELDSDFCSASLRAIPVGRAANLQGLALIAMELALENATTTISTIEKMISSGKFDAFSTRCLKDCLGLYSSAVPMLVNSVGAFLAEQFDAATLLLNAVMEITWTCEEGFKEKEGHVCPLTKENYSFFQLNDIALCIINLVSAMADSKPSST